MNWLEAEEPWFEDINGNYWAKYPVLDFPGRYVYANYGGEERPDLEQLILSHRQGDGKITRWTSLNRFCGNCHFCITDVEECELYNQYHFYEFNCYKTKQPFYLVVTHNDPCIVTESDWFFIPGNPFNVQIFNIKYLGGKHYIGK